MKEKTGNRATPVPPCEPEAVISPLEEKVEAWRQRGSLFLGPLLGLAVRLMPMRGVSPEAHVLAAIITWIVVWWVGEPVPIPVSALLGAILCILAGVADAKTVLAPFADPTIFLFLGSFILARAMNVHGLDRRFAFGILSMGWIGDRTWRILFAYGAISAFISMWISNTATTAMMFPIGLGIIAAMAGLLEKNCGRAIDPARFRFATGMMLMAAYASSVGGIGTPVGTPPNLIGLAMIERFAGVKIPFFRWMLFAVPMMLVMYLLLFFLLYFLHKPEMPVIAG
ncbi:MAG TPA: SLC13 family permease, partial [Acidobacteriota bacterium]